MLNLFFIIIFIIISRLGLHVYCSFLPSKMSERKKEENTYQLSFTATQMSDMENEIRKLETYISVFTNQQLFSSIFGCQAYF